MARLYGLGWQPLPRDNEVCLEVTRFAHVRRAWEGVSRGFSAYPRTPELLSTVSIFANHTRNL